MQNNQRKDKDRHKRKARITENNHPEKENYDIQDTTTFGVKWLIGL